jgi:diadenosine tetraphosphate (Ap4A) HIT family hydrolase
MPNNPLPSAKFTVDDRITSTCFHLGDWPLSCVFLKNNVNYPWLILVPRHLNLQELHELPEESQGLLMRELCALSKITQKTFKSDKLNIGALGNVVSQLHLHVIARFTHDDLWPHGVWQSDQHVTPYPELKITPLLASLKTQMGEWNFR